MGQTHWKKAFKSDYLSSADIDDKDVNLTIAKVVYKECLTASGKKFCNVAIFTDTVLDHKGICTSGTKPMILNVTNSKTIKKFSGNKQHLEEWVNIPIRVYVDAKVKFGSDIVEGLRIRDLQPTATKPKLTKSMPAWGNACKYLRDNSTSDTSEIEKRYDISEVKEQLLREAHE